MTWAPQEAESTFSMLEHTMSEQIQSSAAPPFPHALQVSLKVHPSPEISPCIYRAQVGDISERGELLGCELITETGHLSF